MGLVALVELVGLVLGAVTTWHFKVTLLKRVPFLQGTEGYKS